MYMYVKGLQNFSFSENFVPTKWLITKELILLELYSSYKKLLLAKSQAKQFLSN